jgi:hypothetical protein
MDDDTAREAHLDRYAFPADEAMRIELEEHLYRDHGCTDCAHMSRFDLINRHDEVHRADA